MQVFVIPHPQPDLNEIVWFKILKSALNCGMVVFYCTFLFIFRIYSITDIPCMWVKLLQKQFHI